MHRRCPPNTSFLAIRPASELERHVPKGMALSTQRPASGIARHSESEGVARPYWRNSPHEPSIRDYSYNAANLRIDGDDLRLMVPRVPWKFLIGFTGLFLPSFVFFAWHFIPEPGIRWSFMFGGPFACVFGFADILHAESP